MQNLVNGRKFQPLYTDKNVYFIQKPVRRTRVEDKILKKKKKHFQACKTTYF